MSLRRVFLYPWLRMVLIASAIIAFPAVQPVSAGESYVQFANRLVTHPPEGAAFSPELEAAILAAANAYRRSQGYAPLKQASPDMMVAARAQAMDLLMQGRVGHVSSRGHDFASRMSAFKPGIMARPVMGENAARSTRHGLSDLETAAYIVGQWIKSSSHRHTLVSRDYLTVATGVARRNGDTYAVQIFVGPEVKSNINLPQ